MQRVQQLVELPRAILRAEEHTQLAPSARGCCGWGRSCRHGGRRSCEVSGCDRHRCCRRLAGGSRRCRCGRIGAHPVDEQLLVMPDSIRPQRSQLDGQLCRRASTAAVRARSMPEESYLFFPSLPPLRHSRPLAHSVLDLAVAQPEPPTRGQERDRGTHRLRRWDGWPPQRWSERRGVWLVVGASETFRHREDEKEKASSKSRCQQGTTVPWHSLSEFVHLPPACFVRWIQTSFKFWPAQSAFFALSSQCPSPPSWCRHAVPPSGSRTGPSAPVEGRLTRRGKGSNARSRGGWRWGGRKLSWAD